MRKTNVFDTHAKASPKVIEPKNRDSLYNQRFKHGRFFRKRDFHENVEDGGGEFQFPLGSTTKAKNN